MVPWRAALGSAWQSKKHHFYCVLQEDAGQQRWCSCSLRACCDVGKGLSRAADSQSWSLVSHSAYAGALSQDILSFTFMGGDFFPPLLPQDIDCKVK